MLFSIRHLLAVTDTPLPHHHNQVPTLFRSFETHLPVSCFSTSSLVKIVALSDASIKDVKRDTVLAKNVKRDTKSAQNVEEDKSYTASYLMSTFGFSQERAVSVSAKFHFKSSEKPDSVLALFEKYEFSPTQIADVVRRRPDVLLMDKDTIIVPKLEFFLSVGMSRDVLAVFISKYPWWLKVSLENFIVPSYSFLKSLLLTDDIVITAITRSPGAFRHVKKRVCPNVKFMAEVKVPECFIRYLVFYYPGVLDVEVNEFKVSVSKVLEMGFDPRKSLFVMALRAVSGPYKVTWDRCYEAYSSWGWSEEEILMAFRKHPNCMVISRSKINKVMDFLVNKCGLNAKLVAQSPIIIAFSFEKRTMPRLSVMQSLSSRGLCQKKHKLSTLISYSEKQFLDKFVVPYEKKVPEVRDLYYEILGRSECRIIK